MTETKDGCQDINNRLDVIIATMAADTSMLGWGSGLGSEAKGLFDSQGREVDVIFGTVLNISTIMLSDSLWGQRVIVDVARNAVVFVPVIG